MALADEIRAVLSDTMNLPQDFLDGMVQFQAQNQLPVKTLNTPLFDVRDYGATRDGVTDDTSAIQSTINAWVTASNDSANGLQPVLVLPPGQYKTTAPLTISYAHNNACVKLISGYGATLVPTFSSGHAIDISPSAGVIRNLTIQGLKIAGTNLPDTANSLLHLGGGAGIFYRCVLRDLALEDVQGDGVLIDGQSYEHQFFGCHMNEIAAGNTTGSGIHITNAGGGAVSSIDIYGGTISGFLHNVFAESPQGGVKIFGGSFLLAHNEGIFMGAGTEGGLYGCHVENAWMSGTASPSWTTSQAGVFIQGRANLFHVHGTANNNKMRYVARIFNTTSSTVVGGMVGNPGANGVDYYLRAEGSANTALTVIGTNTGITGVIHDGTPATAKTARIGCSIDLAGTPTSPTAIRIDKGAEQRTRLADTYSASITPDASQGDFHTIQVTNGTAFTINAPTNPPDALHVQELSIEIQNSSGGVMGAITWNAAFKFPGTTWVNPASGLHRRVTFLWNGVNWIADRFTTADY